MLTLAGDLDEPAILQQLADRLARQDSPGWQPGRLILPAEPAKPVLAADRLAMDVTAPSFLVGFKNPETHPAGRLSGRELAFRQKAGRLLLETLLSPASPLYDSFYAAGLINDSFGFHYACEDSFDFFVCGGESAQPEEAAVTIRDRLVEYFRQGVDPQLFDIQKRAAAGDFVRSLDSVEASGMVQAQCNLYGIDLFDYPDLYDKMDSITASRMLAFLGDVTCSSITILHPEVKTAYDT
jgi:predicted Zn-dependent peptidase